MGTTPSLALRRICPMGAMHGGMAFQYAVSRSMSREIADGPCERSASKKEQDAPARRDMTEGLVERRRLVSEEDFCSFSRRGQHGQAHFQIRFAPTSAMGR